MLTPIGPGCCAKSRVTIGIIVRQACDSTHRLTERCPNNYRIMLGQLVRASDQKPLLNSPGTKPAGQGGRFRAGRIFAGQWEGVGVTMGVYDK